MSALYSPTILSLAVSLAEYPLSDELNLRGEAHSRVCGSTLTMAANTNAEGRISRLGMRVSACAIGQASAAVFAQGAEGLGREDISIALDEIDGWLSGSADVPDWPLFDQLIPALPHTGRHEAIRLPWRAAIAMLSNDRTGG